MSPIIEGCVRNVDDRDRRRLRRRDDGRVRPCLEHCGTCLNDRFLVVDGELVTGRSCDRYLPDEEAETGEGHE